MSVWYPTRNAPSQIWESDITFFGDKECDALAHENIFFTFAVLCHKNVTFWPHRYKTFLNRKKCDDSAGKIRGFGPLSKSRLAVIMSLLASSTQVLFTVTIISWM